MSLFNSQTIFSILITLIICSAMFIFFRLRLQVLEISQREQAKVLQSLVMNMKSGGYRQNMLSDEEITKLVNMQMQQDSNSRLAHGATTTGGSGGSGGSYGQNNRTNDLIQVSDEEDDDDEDEDDDSSSESDSESSSDSGDDTDASSEDENEETHDNTTKKIIFKNSVTLDSQTTEHLTGDDIKVIELTEPLYPVGSSSKHDTNHVSDDDGNDDQDTSEDDVSDGDDNDNDDNDDDNEDETSDDTEVKVEELPSNASLSLQQQESHLEGSTIDTTEIKTIFKADKQQQQKQHQQHTDYNAMNVQALRQQVKIKLSSQGLQYNETAINKLNKKELIKHLSQ